MQTHSPDTSATYASLLESQKKSVLVLTVNWKQNQQQFVYCVDLEKGSLFTPCLPLFPLCYFRKPVQCSLVCKN